MSKRIPIEHDLVVSLWARLAIIEQCSLAIVYRSFPFPEPEHATKLADQFAAQAVKQLGKSL